MGNIWNGVLLFKGAQEPGGETVFEVKLIFKTGEGRRVVAQFMD